MSSSRRISARLADTVENFERSAVLPDLSEVSEYLFSDWPLFLRSNHRIAASRQETK